MKMKSEKLPGNKAMLLVPFVPEITAAATVHCGNRADNNFTECPVFYQGTNALSIGLQKKRKEF